MSPPSRRGSRSFALPSTIRTSGPIPRSQSLRRPARWRGSGCLYGKHSAQLCGQHLRQSHHSISIRCDSPGPLRLWRRWIPVRSHRALVGQAGGGLDFRFSKKLGLFVDARYVFTDETQNFGVGRLGLRFGFEPALIRRSSIQPSRL